MEPGIPHANSNPVRDCCNAYPQTVAKEAPAPASSTLFSFKLMSKNAPPNCITAPLIPLSFTSKLEPFPITIQGTPNSFAAV